MQAVKSNNLVKELVRSEWTDTAITSSKSAGVTSLSIAYADSSCSNKINNFLFYVCISVHHNSILYEESTRCNFGSIVY